MRYFKNADLAKLYNVSEKAVRNWIEGAQQKKIHLELVTDKDKVFIADSLHNGFELQELVESGKKYRNGRSYRKLQPTTQFYEFYSPTQISDLATYIEIFREIPQQYRYRGEGATYWNNYLHKLNKTGRGSTLSSTIDLISLNFATLDSLTAEYDYVNVFDIGVGNGLVVKNFLSHLHQAKKLKRYVGIDISPELLSMTEQNIVRWFKNEIAMEKHVRDITYESIKDIVDYATRSSKTVNIFLFFGATIVNFKDPWRPLSNIQAGMSKDDLLFSSLKLDSDRARRFFDFNTEQEVKAAPPIHDVYMLNLLNIDSTLYDEEQFFDKEKMCRLLQVKTKVTIDLQLKIGKSTKIIGIEKGERILLWRARHYSSDDYIQLFNKCGFDMVHATKTKDQEYMLLISKVRSARHLPPPTGRH